MLKTLGKRITAGQAMAAARATREAGLNLSIYLITGVPGEGEEELQATIRLIEQLRPHDGQVSPLAYYPGTALFEGGVKAGRIPSDLFETAQGEAFYVRNDQFVVRSTATILAQLDKTARKSRYTVKDFVAQREFLGYCHATNIMAGEMYEERGEVAAAMREYKEVISREPENPWGWLAAGELYLSMGAAHKADQAFRQLLRLVPANRTAQEAMAELAKLGAGKRVKRGKSAKPQGKRGGGGT
jgi:tetratricopeptide (TPR) repeat protein